jgi:hypothetical protein
MTKSSKQAPEAVKVRTPAEWRRMCRDHDEECTMAFASVSASHVLNESISAVKELLGREDVDFDLVSAHATISAAFIARHWRG